MKAKYFSPLSIVIFLLAILFLSIIGRNNPHIEQEAITQQDIYEFSAPSLFDDNKMISPSLLLGKKYILHFFASWCRVCLAEHADLLQIRKKYNIPIYGIAVRDNIKNTKYWLENYGNPFEDVIADHSGVISINLGLRGLPESYLVDEQGVIIARVMGQLTDKIFQEQFLMTTDNEQQ